MAGKDNKGVKKYTAGGYYQVTDGEWVPTNWRDNKDQCCDCGLVHRVNYRVNEDGKLEVQVFRDPRATNGARRHSKFTKRES